MSADNYLYVAPRGKRFAIVMRFASDDETLRIRRDERSWEEFDSPVAAVARAHALCREEVVEYGVCLHPKVLEALGGAS